MVVQSEQWILLFASSLLLFGITDKALLWPCCAHFSKEVSMVRLFYLKFLGLLSPNNFKNYTILNHYKKYCNLPFYY